MQFMNSVSRKNNPGNSIQSKSVPYSEISEIKKYLSQLHIVVSNEWIEACILFLKQEQGSISVSTLQKSVYQQWLVADLEEIACPCLPHDLPTLQKTTLTKNFALQVEGIRDISKPAYSQLKELEGSANSNAEFSSAPKPYVPEWEAKPKRMLLLNLTDGCTNIQAMEYEPIGFLSPNLPPGLKVLIKGPVDCRFGIFLLTADKISILGGEVENKLDKYSREAVLRNILNMPAQETEVESLPSVNNNAYNVSLPNNVNIRTTELNQHNNLLQESHVSPYENSDQQNDILDNFDDDFEQSIDYGVIDEIEHSQVQAVSNAVQQSDTCDVDWNEDEDVLREMMEFQERNSTIELLPNMPGEAVSEKPKKEPFTYLSLVLKEKPENCTVKGFIITVLSKLECTSKGWSLMVKINDGTATLDASIHDKVLENIIGISAPDMVKKQAEAIKNKDKRKEVMEAISKCKLTLQNFSGLMEIKFSSNDKPCIVQFSELSDLQVHQLLERVQSNS